MSPKDLTREVLLSLSSRDDFASVEILDNDPNAIAIEVADGDLFFLVVTPA